MVLHENELTSERVVRLRVRENRVDIRVIVESNPPCTQDAIDAVCEAAIDLLSPIAELGLMKAVEFAEQQ